MGYRTILVHLNNEHRTRPLMETASAYAREFEAHLIGLRVFPGSRLDLPLPIPMPVGSEVLAGLKARVQQETDRIKSLFDTVTRSQPYVAEWRDVVTERRDAASVVLEHARSCDLVIASQADPEWEYSSFLDFPDRLALEAGRPVLIVPNGGHFPTLPRRVLVAWANRREAARALFDALPVLKHAENVTVLMVADERSEVEGAPPQTEIAAALARHGVKAQVLRVPVTQFTIGEEIRVRAIDGQNDLVVMGAYGHSRFREFAFGGVTRHLLRDMTMPVLFAH